MYLNVVKVLCFSSEIDFLGYLPAVKPDTIEKLCKIL